MYCGSLVTVCFTLQNTSSEVCDFLGVMTGISVSVVTRNAKEIVYHCRLEDGKLKGII